LTAFASVLVAGIGRRIKKGTFVEDVSCARVGL